MSKCAVIGDTPAMMDEVVPLSPVAEKKESPISLFSRLLQFRGRSTSESETQDPGFTYYSVYIPCEFKKGPDEEAVHVYKEKQAAMELVRRYKQARFKSFRSMQDAVAFALRGACLESNDPREPLMGEKPYPFKGPSPQDMVALRKAIEAGLECTVRERVWENPRYLVSSGNTPAILQEGSRYNALHVAAKALNAEMCNLILTTVGNPDFVERLYGVDTDPATCKEFAILLVDRYLNTPDKGLNETPLHFAAKFGAVDVVDVLTMFPQCNKQAVNKYGEMPKDIICKRDCGKDSTAAEKILRMLGERYYVPVYHSEDDSRQPTIGEPFTPATPPDLNVDPMSPRLEIRAFAGPMQLGDAAQFRRKWKTPPRARGERAGLLSPATFRLREMSKGLECAGRNLAEEMKVGWKEYWPFLDTFTDFRTPEGLALLENYLKTQYETAYSVAEFHNSVESMQASPEELSRIIYERSPIKDVLSPVSDLCVALKGCSLSSVDRPSQFRARTRRLLHPKFVETNGENNYPVVNHTVSQLMCIERTCQVFAKRIADALNLSLSAEPEVAGESLKSEAKHLQHTIYSYMDDERFKKIDFALIHSRLAQLVVLKLRLYVKELDDINALIEFLSKLRCTTEDIFSSDEDRKPSYRYSSRNKKVQAAVESHVKCLAGFITEELMDGGILKGPSTTEDECVVVWGGASKCTCEWVIDNFDRNNRRSASFKRRSILSTSPKSDVAKQLLFEHEIGDVRTKHPTLPDINYNSPAGDSPFGNPGKVTSPIGIPGGAWRPGEVGSPVGSPGKAWSPVGSPSKEGIFTINVDKCEVVTCAQMSEDDSDNSNVDGEGFLTASENSASDIEEEEQDKMEDASSHALAEAFIYGDEPTKMDRLVFDAISEVEITPEDFPSIYRWRHTVALYPTEERNKWQPFSASDDSAESIHYSFNLARVLVSPTRGQRKRTLKDSCGSPFPEKPRTPRKDAGSDAASRNVSLQVSNWLRVTGPNSPRTTLSNKNVGHNVSFGF